jgi:hypothetical protein
VRFVDGEQVDAGAAQALGEAGVGEALGGDVEQGGAALHEVEVALVLLFAGEVGVDEGRGDAGSLEAFDLVLHEGDERGDDERAAGLERGEDVAEALAAAGGHDGEHVAGGEGAEDVGLAVAKVGEAEGVAQAGAVGVEVGGERCASRGRGGARG